MANEYANLFVFWHSKVFCMGLTRILLFLSSFELIFLCIFSGERWKCNIDEDARSDWLTSDIKRLHLHHGTETTQCTIKPTNLLIYRCYFEKTLPGGEMRKYSLYQSQMHKWMESYISGGCLDKRYSLKN